MLNNSIPFNFCLVGILPFLVDYTLFTLYNTYQRCPELLSHEYGKPGNVECVYYDT